VAENKGVDAGCGGARSWERGDTKRQLPNFHGFSSSVNERCKQPYIEIQWFSTEQFRRIFSFKAIYGLRLLDSEVANAIS
jgi:hypothetical protein